MRALLVLSLCLLPACASFESGELPYLDAWPPATVEPSHGLAVSVQGLPDKFDRGWQQVIRRTLTESGRFAFVAAPEAETAQRTLRLEIQHQRQSLPTTRTLMVMCALTLGVLPARAHHEFDVHAVVLDANGTRLGAIDRHVESSTWIGWVFVFALPFAGVGMTGMVEDTVRSIVGEAVANGWL
jgi:hypothetical protein